MRPIDAEAILKHSFDGYYREGDFDVFATFVPALVIENAPTIKAKPIVYGKWEVVSTEKDKWVNKCTACGAYLKRGYKQTNYCPNCGAKMFGKEGE